MCIRDRGNTKEGGIQVEGAVMMPAYMKNDEQMLKEITTGACLSVNGVLTESVGSGQKAEIQAREIEVLGTCDNTYHPAVSAHSPKK